MDEPTVRNSIRVRRAICDLTQANFAEPAGITRASVNAIEGGCTFPSIFSALKLARAPGVSVYDRFRLSGDERTRRDPVPTEKS